MLAQIIQLQDLKSYYTGWNEQFWGVLLSWGPSEIVPL